MRAILTHSVLAVAVAALVLTSETAFAHGGSMGNSRGTSVRSTSLSTPMFNGSWKFVKPVSSNFSGLGLNKPIGGNKLGFGKDFKYGKYPYEKFDYCDHHHCYDWWFDSCYGYPSCSCYDEGPSCPCYLVYPGVRPCCPGYETCPQ